MQTTLEFPPKDMYDIVCINVYLGIDSCASLPCGRNGVCENKGVDGYACQCDDGWLGSNCQYRFENATFFWANKTGLVGAKNKYRANKIYYSVNVSYLINVSPHNTFL